MPSEYIKCRDCEDEFEFTEEEQEYFARGGARIGEDVQPAYPPPIRCKECRFKKKKRMEVFDRNRG